ncbi:uncharacterized protein LOC126381517 [Pectinophora gossypiella]|uniref:uncharacterized protein LOC126381517 n=1 Tax=Pectinophora gossypiella TaxID=13191 RepID=UPI00214F2999|nr:uncharacterized protein LOC126381517 [Pectinophora gossypiella]
MAGTASNYPRGARGGRGGRGAGRGARRAAPARGGGAGTYCLSQAAPRAPSADQDNRGERPGNETSDNDDDEPIYQMSHESLFDGTLGRYRGSPVRLHVREGAQPVYHRARPVPYTLRPRVDAELDAMLCAALWNMVEQTQNGIRKTEKPNYEDTITQPYTASCENVNEDDYENNNSASDKDYNERSNDSDNHSIDLENSSDSFKTVEWNDDTEDNLSSWSLTPEDFTNVPYGVRNERGKLMLDQKLQNLDTPKLNKSTQHDKTTNSE